MRQIAREVPIAQHVKEYALRVVLGTHPDSEHAPDSVRRLVRFGSSPRGAQALILTAKIRALLQGRFNVAYEDLDAVAYPALRHRLILSFEGEAEGTDPDALIREILTGVAAAVTPRVPV
jgi:MoxR-like ATPase